MLELQLSEYNATLRDQCLIKQIITKQGSAKYRTYKSELYMVHIGNYIVINDIQARHSNIVLTIYK